jgi:dTDP-4-dehydrorhamnose 3,5-epimerase-like enzyme
MYYGLSVLVFTFLFTFYPASEYEFTPNMVETWVWNKTGGYGTRAYKNSEDPVKYLNGYKIKNNFFSFLSKKFYQIPEDRLIDYPLTGEGFFEYKKLGDEISYYSGYRELFWKKPISSYPRPGYYSKLLPLVSGDGNTVFLVDRNGVPTGITSVDGRFAVDIGYATNSERIFLLFSGGEYFLFSEHGEIITQHQVVDTEHKTSYFAKSTAVSEDGSIYGIHFQSSDRDYIKVMNDQGKVLYDLELDKIYPHKLHFSLSNKGSMILALPNQYQLISHKGKIILSQDSIKLDTYYNPTFVKNDLFMIGLQDKIIVLNSEGRVVWEKSFPINANPYRFLPSEWKNVFYIETSQDIRQVTQFHK